MAQITRPLHQMLGYLLTVLPAFSSRLFTVHSATPNAATIAWRGHVCANHVIIFTIVSLARRRLQNRVPEVATNDVLVPSVLADVDTEVTLANPSSFGAGRIGAQYRSWGHWPTFPFVCQPYQIVSVDLLLSTLTCTTVECRRTLQRITSRKGPVCINMHQAETMSGVVGILNAEVR